MIGVEKYEECIPIQDWGSGRHVNVVTLVGKSTGNTDPVEVSTNPTMISIEASTTISKKGLFVAFSTKIYVRADAPNPGVGYFLGGVGEKDSFDAKQQQREECHKTNTRRK